MSNPEDEVKEQLPWISEVALKKLDASDRAFDAINNRAGVVIGWAGLLTSVFMPALKNLPTTLRASILTIWVFPFLLMLYHGYRAYAVAKLKPVPITDHMLDEFTSKPPVEARAEMIRMIVQASEYNELSAFNKAFHLRKSINYFAIQLIILVASLFVSTLWP
jgi:hypothetical protein